MLTGEKEVGSGGAAGERRWWGGRARREEAERAVGGSLPQTLQQQGRGTLSPAGLPDPLSRSSSRLPRTLGFLIQEQEAERAI